MISNIRSLIMKYNIDFQHYLMELKYIKHIICFKTQSSDLLDEYETQPDQRLHTHLALIYNSKEFGLVSNTYFASFCNS